MRNKYLSFLLLFIWMIFCVYSAYAQKFKLIQLPDAINSVNQEFSGMTMYKNRLYFIPQYGNHKETKLDAAFDLYSINADSIGRVIDGKDASLTAYRTIHVLNLNQLPDSVKKYYEGFEAITIVNNTVYLSIETTDTYNYCFLLKGTLDTVRNQIRIDPKHFISLKRQLFIVNAGFESVTYLPKEKKLLAYYEFNASPKGGIGFLIDPAFKKLLQKIRTPFLYFRITDIAATKTDQIYGINYFYSGDYDFYLNNKIVTKPESRIKSIIPSLRDSLNKDTAYLKNKKTTFARIVTLDSYKGSQWKQVATFEGYKNNWEGIALFRKGALVVTDANRSSKQLSSFGYVEF